MLSPARAIVAVLAEEQYGLASGSTNDMGWSSPPYGDDPHCSQLYDRATGFFKVNTHIASAFSGIARHNFSSIMRVLERESSQQVVAHQ